MGHPAKKIEIGKVIDPVCGMEVSDDSEYHYGFAGVEYHFCSEHCESQFEADPSRF
ncbi:YHS domain-containing protein, partial [Thiolapillus sp.]|uniref:YHS domain-containing protein n=1 Tax=Thiolapillus sp. TaxID=2017437 RepID=UPI003AF41459